MELGRDKLDRMEFLLSYFQTVPVDSPDQISIYSEIDNFCLERGRVMGKNDLWIAATAALTDARLLTSDADFELHDGVFLNLDGSEPRKVNRLAATPRRN